MFRRTLRGVVQMNPREMARNDGSAAVAGRGQGMDVPVKKAPRKEAAIPFMQMTFAPLERRLDTAVYRALFASSVRQARNMCVHGKVMVNGVKMPHAGYMLNPGDMFSVDPLLVMRAVGQASSRAFRRLSDKAKLDLQTAIEEAQKKPKSKNLKLEENTVRASNANAEVDPADSTVVQSTSSESTPMEGESAETETEEPKQLTQLPSDWRTFLPKYPRWKIYDEWQPKRFMNLFAFIPRYLEVNHNICHAVYLRHPVARAGSTEIPNPFNNETMQLAFAWYLRRR
ncbi:hypothetical protein ABW19_dt0207861 [Dactylella cylindrospora]|nr:hypothetical protein ABW19_dt0207861 [Dactylella cylindrospora]